MTVKIEKTGLFTYDWNGDRRKYVRRRVKKMRVFTHLRDDCEIADGVTLLDIFQIVGKYKLLRMFIAHYSWCRAIDEYHAQAEEPDYGEAEENPDEKMTHLEIYWHADYGNYKKEEPWLSLSPSFHGVGPARGEYAKDGALDGMMYWGIDFSPMYRLAHLPVKLDNSVELFKLGDYNQARKPIVKATRAFSLQDVLDAIYWEISFHGSPSSKSERLEDLKESVDEIKYGLMKGIPAEDVFPELGQVKDDPKKPKIILHEDVLRTLGMNPDDYKKED